MLALMTAAGLVVQLVGTPAVKLSGQELRLRDVAVVAGGQGNIGARPLGRLNSGATMQLSSEQLLRLVRLALPGATIRGAAPSVLTVIAAPAADGPRPTCFAAAGLIRQGERVTAERLASVQCRSDPGSASIGFNADRGGAVALADIAADAYLGALAPARAERLARGDQVRLVATAGSVTVTRAVTAFQSASAKDDRVFVRARDGEIMSVRVADLEGKR